MTKFTSMSQKLELKEDGLNFVKLGARIDTVAMVAPIAKHRKIADIRMAFNNQFDYYFIDSDSMFIDDAGIVKDVFLARGRSGEVASIFIFLENANSSLVPLINKVFGDPKLQAASSVSGLPTNSKFFWKKKDVSVFLLFQRGSTYSKITISQAVLNETTPGINIDY